MAGQGSTQSPNSRRWLILALAVIALLVIVLILLLAQCGDDDDAQVAQMETPAAMETEPPGETPPASDSGPVAQWLFDGNAADATGNGHDAMELGGVEYADGAATLDGIDDAFRVANAPDLNPPDAITMAAWWTAADFVGAGNNALVDKGFTSHDPPHYQYHLGVTGTGYTEGGNFGSWVAADGAAASVFSSGWTAAELYHVVGIYDGSEVRLYVNGELSLSKEASGSMTDYGQDLYIARFTNLDQAEVHFIPGLLHEVTIWDRALGEEEVAALYAAGAQ